MTHSVTARAATDAATSERQFQSAVLDLATLLGWRHYHVPDSRRSEAGWPDLALWRPPRFMLVELKRDGGRLTRVQAETLEDLCRCGVEVHTWRPSDWPEIEITLR